MAKLLLGPLLRHVGETHATLWVETDEACEVEILGTRERTFCVDGHHYALVVVDGLEPGATLHYAVMLDGRQAWPETGSALPDPIVRTFHDEQDLSVVFGSCRVSLPHEPPYVCDGQDEDEGQGIDALRALALRLTRTPPADWPALLVMLGDQVYADDLSPAMLAITERREGHDDAPRDQLMTFEEYTLAYREAWGEPLIRWLLSVIPVAMIFDDHEIHAEWKISELWVERMRKEPWYDRRVANGLSAYWIYQHLGNLSPETLAENATYARVRGERDAGKVLRAEMADADQQPGHSRWSYSRDLGHTRLVVIDSRAGRVLEDGHREMIEEGEWRWIEEQAVGGFDHLLLASSVPFLLSHGLHDLEASIDALAAGSRGRLVAGISERIRVNAVLDHWASFGNSFRRLSQLLADVATGKRGDAPSSIVMLSGDVHHCYLVEAGFPAGTGAQSSVYQAVSSAYRKDLASSEMKAMRLGNSRTGALIGRVLGRAAKAERFPIDWRTVEEPRYDNQVSTLELGAGRARLRVESTTGADWRAPELTQLYERTLVGSAPEGGQPPATTASGRASRARSRRVDIPSLR